MSFTKFLRLLPLLVLTYSYGQSSGTLEIIENNPNRSFIRAGISLGFLFGGYNMSLPYAGLNGNIITPKYAASYSAKYSLYDRVSFDDYMTISSIYEPEPSRSIAAEFSFFPIKIIKEEPIRVVVKSGRTVSGHYEKYINVPGLVRHNYGFDLGFQAGTTFYFMDDFFFTAIAFDGTPYPVGDPTGGFYFTLNEQMSTFFNYGFVRLGVNTLSSRSLTINSPSLGKHSTNGFTKYYAHLFIGAYQKVDDVYYKAEDPLDPTEIVLVRMDINTNMPYRKCGWAIGYSAFGMNKWNLDFNMEFGMLPGPKQNLKRDGYFDFSIALNLGKEIGLKHPIE